MRHGRSFDKIKIAFGKQKIKRQKRENQKGKNLSQYYNLNCEDQRQRIGPVLSKQTHWKANIIIRILEY